MFRIIFVNMIESQLMTEKIVEWNEGWGETAYLTSL